MREHRVDAAVAPAQTRSDARWHARAAPSLTSNERASTAVLQSVLRVLMGHPDKGGVPRRAMASADEPGGTPFADRTAYCAASTPLVAAKYRAEMPHYARLTVVRAEHSGLRRETNASQLTGASLSDDWTSCRR